MKRIYILAGPNGAGKTTASQSLLPELLDCQEFVNADEIAKALSPYKPESVALEAGRIMLSRINHLMAAGETFAFETTLATKSYKNLLLRAKGKGYETYLIFIYLNSPSLALKRVQTRVIEGGHNIPEETIFRRYSNGLKNFFHIYMDNVDEWIFVDNSNNDAKIIAEGNSFENNILDLNTWTLISKNNL
jgi:predicted ABC-type ATPase